jgi:glutamine synthetase
LPEFAADVLADREQLQTPGRRLLGADQADLGHRQPNRRGFRVIPGSAKSTRLETARPRRRREPLPRDGGLSSPPACTASRRASSSRPPPIEGTNRGAEHIPRAPRSLADDHEDLPRSPTSPATGFGDTFVDHFAATREWEHRQWQDAVTDWELKRYFEII